MIIVLTQNNNLGIFDNEGTLLNQRELVDTSEEDILGNSITICDRNKYLFIHQVEEVFSLMSSRVLVLRLSDLSEVARLNTKELNAKSFSSFSFFGYLGNSAVIVGLTAQDFPTLFTFRYETEEEVLEEVEGERRNFSFGQVCKLTKMENGGLVGISMDKRLLEVKYSISD